MDENQNRRQDDKLKEIEKVLVGMSRLPTDIEYIRRDIADIKEKLEKDYVTRTEFNPVKNIVYGLVGIILISVIGAILALVVTQQ